MVVSASKYGRLPLVDRLFNFNGSEYIFVYIPNTTKNNYKTFCRGRMFDKVDEVK